MSEATIAWSKFRPPRLPLQLMTRPELVDKLQQQALERTLVFLTAPAGFGKTTLLGMWYQYLQHPVAWVSLGKDDDDLILFWSHLFHALNTIQPGITDNALTMLHHPHLPNSEAVITSVINQLQHHSEPCLLILDDYHMIKNNAIHRTFFFLLEHLPPCLHLVIATREELPFSLARLRVQGELAELRLEHLRFTTKEITSFFHDVAGIPLSEAEIHIVEARTEGK